MKQLILQKVLQKIGNMTEDYINSIQNTIDNFIEYTELPKVYQTNFIDTTKLPLKTSKLLKDVDNLISTHTSIGIERENYKDCGFLAALLISKYLKDSIIEDKHLNTILYVDTNLLMEDYKKLMDKNSDGTSPMLVHSLNVLNKEIEQADFVFWDKFTMIQSNYELMKIYDILSIRYRNCLGNVFFITPDYNNILSVELYNVMNLKSILDLLKEEYSYIK